MEYITPNIEYNSIKINGKDIYLSGTAKASFTAPYNKIDFVMTPKNGSLSYYEVRITKENDDYDIGVGTLAYWAANVAGNEAKSFSIDVNSTNFSSGDGKYRISLYGKSATDGSWDVTYIFFTVDNEQFIVLNGSDFEVLTDREEPTH